MALEAGIFVSGHQERWQSCRLFLTFRAFESNRKSTASALAAHNSAIAAQHCGGSGAAAPHKGLGFTAVLRLSSTLVQFVAGCLRAEIRGGW